MKKQLPLLLPSLLTLPAAAQQQDSPKPNIIVILADDMGFSDIGCYGGEVETPNIDNLASNGIRYRQFYNGARSCPTRASLLTGLYAHQAGMGWMAAADMGCPAYQGTLNNECVTIAEVLKGAGYTTYMSGKWHVSSDRENNGGITDNWPNQRGFDTFFGIVGGSANYFNMKYNYNNDRFQSPQNSDFYLTHALSDSARVFVERHDYAKSPLFLYLSYTAPHWPLHALQADIDKYKERYMKGWDVLREERFKKQKELGLFAEDVEMNPRDPDVSAWNSLTQEKKEEFAMRMAIYAAQIDAMDQGIGKLVDELKKQGQFENTVIMFLSDNGACAEFISSGRKAVDGKADTYESYRESWANLSSTPYREYKHHTNEGGIATPMIIHYPNGIPAERNNSLINEYGHITDIMATCVDLSGAAYPAEYKGHAITPMQGVSLKPNFTGETTLRGKTFWEHEGNIAVREGKWKIVTKTVEGQPFDEKTMKLYDMEADPTELYDLSGKYPEIKSKMYADWQKWAEENEVLPMDTRAYGTRQQDYKRNAINGEFDYNYGDWATTCTAPAEIDYMIETENPISGKKSAKIHVKKQGNFPRHGFLKWEFNGKKNEKVNIGFKVKSSQNTDIYCRLEYTADPAQKQIDQTIHVTPEITDYSFTSTSLPYDGGYQLAFYVGKASGIIELDKVTMEIEPAPITSNTDINGEFDSDYEGWRKEVSSPAQINFGIETDNPISGEKSARVTINKKGDLPRRGLMAWDFKGEKGDIVDASFKIKSSVNTNIFFRLEYRADPAQKQIDKAVSVTQDVNTHTFQSKPLPHNGNYQMVFYFGQAEIGDIWIDQVTLGINNLSTSITRNVSDNQWLRYDGISKIIHLMDITRISNVKMYDSTGRLVLNETSPQKELSLDGVDPGIYILCLYDHNKLLHTQKILL